jgi:hypothetical protein
MVINEKKQYFQINTQTSPYQSAKRATTLSIAWKNAGHETMLNEININIKIKHNNYKSGFKSMQTIIIQAPFNLMSLQSITHGPSHQIFLRASLLA